MGSRLNVILKRDGVLTVSYSRIRALNLPTYLAFGPIAAWEGLSEHQYSAALFKSSWGQSEWINNDFLSVAHMIDSGDEGSVIVDWDDKVLWYFTDFDYESYGGDFWGSWFASWLDVFWPEWVILRPRTRSFRDIKEKLGLRNEKEKRLSWDSSVDINYNIYDSSETKSDQPSSTETNKSYFAIVNNANLKFQKLRPYVYIDDLIYGGPSLIREDAPSIDANFLTYVDFLGQHEVIGLVDLDRKQTYFSGGFRGEDANPYTAWTGWKAQADRQGLCSWVANTDIDWPIDTESLEAEVDNYFEKILKWCAEVGPSNEAVSKSLRDILSFPIQETPLKENPFPRKPDPSGSIVISGQDDNTDIDEYLRASKSNQTIRAGNYRQFYEQMKNTYLSDARLKERIMIDRHHSKSDWEPDLEAYSVLNKHNPNVTVN